MHIQLDSSNIKTKPLSHIMLHINGINYSPNANSSITAIYSTMSAIGEQLYIYICTNLKATKLYHSQHATALSLQRNKGYQRRH